jgi:polyisoprenoid-binding protein YceI
MLSLRTTFTSALTSALLLASSVAFASDWDVDAAHTHVGFGIRHMMVSTVHGTFKTFTGAVSIDDANMANSKVHLEIDVSSISTDNDKRDDHLRSPDFFDAAHFPKMVFDSTSVQRLAPDHLSVTGNLTIKNVTKSVVLNVTGLTPDTKDPFGGVRRGATASGKISRKDFGLSWNKAMDGGGVVLGDDVNLEIEVELSKKK